MVRSALGVALFRAPFESEPGKVAKLQNPGDCVCGNDELVVENCSFVHMYPSNLDIVPGRSSGAGQGLFGLCGCVLLVLAFHAVAKEKDKQAPAEPCQHIPAKGSEHGRILNA